VIAAVFAIGAIVYFLISRKKNENLEEDENLNRLRLAFKEMDFIFSDLHRHLCRVYLAGTNEMHQPWQLPLVPPQQLRNRIDLDRYLEFAKVSFRMVLY